MSKKDTEKYSNFSNVEDRNNYVIPEEIPEGPYGSPINKNKLVSGKSTPWKEGQRFQSPYTYANKDFHDDLPRQADGAHPIHDHEGEQPNEEK